MRPAPAALALHPMSDMACGPAKPLVANTGCKPLTQTSGSNATVRYTHPPCHLHAAAKVHVGRECIRELPQQLPTLQVDAQAGLGGRGAWQEARVRVKQHQVLTRHKGGQVGQVVPGGSHQGTSQQPGAASLCMSLSNQLRPQLVAGNYKHRPTQASARRKIA